MLLRALSYYGFFALLLCWGVPISAQVSLTSVTITPAKLKRGEDTYVTAKFSLVYRGVGTTTGRCAYSFTSSDPSIVHPADINLISVVRKAALNRISLRGGEVETFECVLYIPKDLVDLLYDHPRSHISFDISFQPLGGESETVGSEELHFDRTYTKDYYGDTESVQLTDREIRSVTYKNGLVTVGGYKADLERWQERNIRLTRPGQYFRYIQKSFLLSSWKAHVDKVPVWVASIPIRVRPKESQERLEGNGASRPRIVTGGLNNLGLNFDYARHATFKHFTNGKKSIHQFGAGIWVGPSVIQLDSTNTAGIGEVPYGEAASNQLFFSSGLTFSYKYNKLSIIIVPLGFDFGLSPRAKSSLYEGQNWYGIGIGLSTSVLGPIFGGD